LSIDHEDACDTNIVRLLVGDYCIRVNFDEKWVLLGMERRFVTSNKEDMMDGAMLGNAIMT
jgi:hypothetical protein